MNISRRGFVGGLAAVAIGSSLPTFASVKTATKTIDVYFHGLWVFVDNGTSISAYAPCSQMHCYMMGRDAKNLQDFAPGNYKFDVDPTPGTKHFSALKNKIDKPPAGLATALASIDRQVAFPHLPASILSLRKGTATWTDKTDFTKQTKGTYTLCQKLTFHFNQPEVKFGAWVSDASHSKDTLHLFAESPAGEHSTHAKRMVNATAELLNLPWALASSTLPAAASSAAEKGLDELKLQCTTPATCNHPLDSGMMTMSASVANCMPIVIGT